MLSFVLPLIVCAIALTPVVASARAVYKRDVEEQIRSFNMNDHCLTQRPEPFKQSDRAKTTRSVETII